MNPILSIVIPCYNTETTLEETLFSVIEQEYQAWEAIIINDGSPDNLEKIALKWIEKDPRFKYYKKRNGGLGAARNLGVEKAKGEYILPLDSDNKIRPNYAKKALNVLKQNPKVGVVYGDAFRFGEENKKWQIGKFDPHKLLVHNYIDACAIIRKSIFDKVGMYDTNMPFQGHEDWEFWLRLLASKHQFYYLQEVCFDYRVTSDSMIRNFDEEMMKANIEYIQNKYAFLYRDAFFEVLKKYNRLKKEVDKSVFSKIKKKLRSK